jgi:hypothetical protein
MARRTIFFVIAIAVPLISLLSHPELRRILLWDAIILDLQATVASDEFAAKAG